MIKEDIKFQNSTVFEGMTSIRAIISALDDGNNDRKIDKILFEKEKIAKIKKFNRRKKIVFIKNIA